MIINTGKGRALPGLYWDSLQRSPGPLVGLRGREEIAVGEVRGGGRDGGFALLLLGG